MRLTRYSHACVRLERDGAVLVIDPGTLSERVALDGADAVLVTHEHFDHLDVEALTEARDKRPDLRIFAHPEVTPKFGDLAGAVTEVQPGDDFEAAGFAVRTYGGLHAVIHSDLPRIANVGFFIEGVYHPGDSYDVPTDAEVETLLVPVSAPWSKLAEAVEFVRQVAPGRVHPIHDGLLNDVGRKVFDTMIGNLSGRDYVRLGAGEAVKL
jgi:L-ascorbate metabolism protein UlaG (beta-lactamase superfamily)